MPETVLLVGAVMLVHWQFFPDSRFGDLQPHPFWIPVLLIAMQYGFGGGVFAAVVASFALYAGALPAREDGVEFYAYLSVLAAQPAAWLAVGAVLGGLRSLHVQRAAMLVARVAESEQRAADVGGGLSRALDEIGRLELAIASNTASVQAVVHGLSKLELTTPAALTRSLGGILHEALGAAACTVYLRDDDVLRPSAVFDEENDPPAPRTPIVSFSALLDALDCPRALIRRGSENARLLPQSMDMLAAIYSERHDILYGAIAIERFRLGHAGSATELATRVRAVAAAVASLLDVFFAFEVVKEQEVPLGKRTA